LTPGTRLGPYEVVAPLGAGGMGEVYRARDTKLAREVAIKVLPEPFLLDADRLARFKRIESRRDVRVRVRGALPNLTSKSSSKSYRVVAVSLYDEELAAANRLADILRRGGWPKANRSLVMREALIRLEEELVGMSVEDVFHYFANRQAKRAAAPVSVHEPGDSAYAKQNDPSK